MSKMPSEDSQPEVNWYILTTGLPAIREPVTLAPGVTLRPLNAPLTVFDLAAAGAVGFRQWSVLEPLASSCTCEIESAKDSDVAPGYDTLNRAWLASTLLVLRGFTRHLCVACSAYSWNQIAGRQERSSPRFRQQLANAGLDPTMQGITSDLAPFKGQLLDFHLKLLVNDTCRRDPIQEEDVAWIYKHFNTFNTLAANSGAFRFALEASVDWRFAKDSRAAISRLWAGIESVFGISSELVYRISLLSACLLAERGSDRQAKFMEVKKLYGLRSKAVHGVTLPESKIANALNGSYALLRDLLILSINRGHALRDEDFDEAVFF
jgi:hypothetical protein